jgi:hypothetical protein
LLQAGTHCPAALQVTLPFGGGVHTVQAFPHDWGLVLPLTMHWAPQAW